VQNNPIVISAYLGEER
ncbi:MAG: hypothetical protein K2H67_02340, partial [Treponemataceae bacterium]|nr:hypothetical protein [Treponemataceae bacterium]